ncbi:lysophospholipid acyltransferase family protein [Parapedobacter tibetensis]|uniref:lysophospholipid acyltransferase family protein n=1 Tax=Parapedobacter tibetensis TaxID=2972951 RepID=UPI00214D390E|nr:lysophospholipid acyltransferase family protein [Parapedobacter tibetensis]
MNVSQLYIKGLNKSQSYSADWRSHVMALLKATFYTAMQIPITLLSLLPYALLRATIGRCCYFLAYSIMRYRYHVVLQNLSRSFPDKPYSEIHALAKGFYWHFSCLVVEVIKSISISKRQLAAKIRITNMDLINQYQAEGRPMVALLGHYGNWESLNILPSKLPFPVNALYKPLSNTMLCGIVRRIRSRFGMQLIPAGKALRQLVKAKNDVSLNLFIADQFPGSNKGCQLEFLNQTTSMFDGAEKLAKAINAVVFYIELERKPDDGWDVYFSLITDKAKDTVEGEITQCFGELLQQTVNKNPTYWLWSHRRWK